MWLSHVSLNLYVHDTFYVVAHFHFMFSAATFSAIFAAYFHYYSVIWGYNFNSFLGFLHWIYWTLGQWITFIPLFWVGYNGLPRRYHDYPYFFLGWHSIATFGHILSTISFILFFVLKYDSFLSTKISSINYLPIIRFYKRLNYFFIKQLLISNSKHSIILCYSFLSSLLQTS